MEDFEDSADGKKTEDGYDKKFFTYHEILTEVRKRWALKFVVFKY